MRSFAYIWASLDPNATMRELVFCISFRGLGARLGSGGRGGDIYDRQKGGSSQKKLEDVRQQKTSSQDEGDIIHQPILPISLHYVKMYKKGYQKING